MNIENLKIFHITNYNNLSSIMNEGLYADVNISDYTNIGHAHIKERRRQTTVIPLSCTLSECVPFYFSIRSPMLYAIYSKSTEYKGGQENIIYLCTTVQEILANELEYCFTDGHAVEAITTYYQDLHHLDKLDWGAIRTNQWSTMYPNVDSDLKRRKQAEFLIKRHVPFSAVKAIAVYDETMYAKVYALLRSSKKIIIKREWYY